MRLGKQHVPGYTKHHFSYVFWQLLLQLKRVFICDGEVRLECVVNGSKVPVNHAFTVDHGEPYFQCYQIKFRVWITYLRFTLSLIWSSLSIITTPVWPRWAFQLRLAAILIDNHSEYFTYGQFRWEWGWGQGNSQWILTVQKIDFKCKLKQCQFMFDIWVNLKTVRNAGLSIDWVMFLFIYCLSRSNRTCAGVGRLHKVLTKFNTRWRTVRKLLFLELM